MRLITNDKLITRQSQIARYATFAGLAVLLGALVTSVVGNFPIVVAYVFLLLGFVLAYVGTTLSNKWLKEPRADHALAKALKGFDNKYHLYNYLLPASHVLLTPTGLLVFKVKPNDGHITCSADRWRRTWRWTFLLGGMGQEPLGNPSSDLQDEIAKMKRLIESQSDGSGDVPIEGYVVFSDPHVHLAVENPSYPVVRADELKDTLRKARRGPPLNPQLLQNLAKILDEQAHEKAA